MAQYGLRHARAEYSKNRLIELSNRLTKLRELEPFRGLTIFAAGSYGRLEASKHSDLDLFFFLTGDGKDVEDLRTNTFRVFGRLIDIADDMDFPKFSNDSEYLQLLNAGAILSNLGGRIDDQANYFTARMLFLLESRCLFGQETFRAVNAQIISSYFKDFPDHPRTFQPIFLINDICRFWKTMLLNYEHKRHTAGNPDDEIKKTKHKVKNFKLKYSRMTTCFASVAALGSFTAPVTEEQVIAITQLTPGERLESVVERIPKTKSLVDEVLNNYSWFLEVTGLPTEELDAHFSDKEKRTEMFSKASDYGDAMFRLLQCIDDSDERLRLLRTLVI